MPGVWGARLFPIYIILTFHAHIKQRGSDNDER
jgi:hypothetical protein